MSRIRTVKPELFVHDALFDAEQLYGLPLRCAFIGLFTQCDREGRFRWQARRLKPLILPHDTVDFAKVLNALAHTGFVKKYLYQGEIYGCIPSWSKHQRINTHEAPSVIPGLEQPGCVPLQGKAIFDASPEFQAQQSLAADKQAALLVQAQQAALETPEASSNQTIHSQEVPVVVELQPGCLSLADKATEQIIPEPSPVFEEQPSLASQEQAVLAQAEEALQPAPLDSPASPLESLRQALRESPSSSPASAEATNPEVPTQHRLRSLEALQGVPWILERSDPLHEIVQASYKEDLQWLEASESGALAPSSFDFLAEDPLFVPKNTEENETHARATQRVPEPASKPWLSKTMHARACIGGKEGKGKEGEWEEEQEGKGSLRGRGSEGGKPPTPPVCAEVPVIFEYWKTVMQHPQAQLDPKRRGLISKALKLGYSADQLCEAISGCSLTPHNQGHNDRGQRFDGLQVILRNADQIDRFRHNYQHPPRILSRESQQQAQNIRELEAWLKIKQGAQSYGSA